MIKYLKNKEKIVNTFLDEISRVPLSSISINNLAKQAHVSRTTFYRLFESIPKLIDFTDEYVDQEVFKNFINATPQTDSAVEWINILVTELYKNRDKLRIMYTSDLKGQWLNYLNNKYKTWLKDNIFKGYHSDLIPEGMAILLFTKSISTLVDYWLSEPIPEKPDIFKIQIFKLLSTAPLNFPNL